MRLGEADTRAKLIDPALHAHGWTEDLGRREETAGATGGSTRGTARESIKAKAGRPEKGPLCFQRSMDGAI